MRFTVVGCSGSIPGPHSPASCYVIEAAGTTVLLDFGSGSLGPLQQYVRLDEIDAVLFSHLHPDHCMDLCGYYVATNHGPWGSGVRASVWGPAGTAERMAMAYGLPADPGMTGQFDFRTYPDSPFDVGSVLVTVAEVVHPVPAYAVRVECEGHVIVYSGDTGPTPALLDLASRADLFVCEAGYWGSEPNPGDVHLTGREAGEHAAAAGVSQLMLTHIPPWGDPSRTSAEARAAFGGPVTLARPGLVVEL